MSAGCLVRTCYVPSQALCDQEGRGTDVMQFNSDGLVEGVAAVRHVSVGRP